MREIRAQRLLLRLNRRTVLIPFRSVSFFYSDAHLLGNIMMMNDDEFGILIKIISVWPTPSDAQT